MIKFMIAAKLIKLKFFLKKISESMKGIQIQLEYKCKRKWRHFLLKLKFLYSISDIIMEIHVKMLNFEDFCGNFHRQNGRHTNKIILQLKKEVDIFSDKSEEFL